MRRYSTDEEARAYFERMRWPNGPVCPHCGSSDKIYARKANAKTGTRAGLYKCGECSDTFRVTVGTVMESSKVPLHKWLIAFYMMCASKTQVSALQLQRQLELGSYRTALFLCHRIRFALKDAGPSGLLSGEVEADETYIGGKARGKGRGYTGNKVAVVSLVQRGGEVRSTVVDRANGKVIDTLLKRHVSEDAHLNTDESPLYNKAGKRHASHARVNHSIEEYGYYDYRTGRNVTTNTVEGFFGNAKRSLDGTHHHVSRQHLDLYAAEIDFKYNTRASTDGERTSEGIRRIEGKRLMYRPKGS
ncbi:IS1595 family transposase [Altererythrobacter aquiaggeris]|uniref:IS1595 family transposase n=1 Tax=Aestuarierythrobacter aquiaggeris TaxID=1898396 RepID=UPI00301AB5F1